MARTHRVLVESVSYKTVNEIISAVSKRFPADAAMAVFSDSIVQTVDYLVK